MFNLIGSIKEIVGITAVMSTIIFSYLNYQKGQEIDRISNNLYSKTVQWEDEKGRLVTEVTELRYTTKELKAVSYADSTKLSSAQKQLLEASRTIKDLRLKEANIETYNRVDLSVKNDSLVTEVVKDENNVLKALKPIKTDHLNITFNVQGDTILVNHSYKAKVSTVVSRHRDAETKKGNKRFFVAKWINPRWKYTAANVIDDKNANIDSAININFQDKKGKR